MNKVILGDALIELKKLKDNSIDLIMTDPPYLIENTNAGGNSNLSKTIQQMNNELKNNNLTNGFNILILNEFIRIMKNINCYIWCNHKQIPMYLNFFVKKNNCSFDIIIWNKTNVPPLFNNKYLTDKEYCLYFRKNGYCNPKNYKNAKTVYYQPINIIDKKKYNHPTIKPLNIISNLIKNSSKENDVILDCFAGSGTTGVACLNLNRSYILIEKENKYIKIIKQRLNIVKNKIVNYF